MAELFWLTEAQFARLSPLLPRSTRGKPRVDDRRVISGIVHALRSGGRAVGGRAGRVRPAQDVVQPLRALVCQGRVGPRLRRAGRGGRAVGGPAADRQRPREGVPQRRRRQRGADAQAIGHSRGGRTSKVHAVVDGQGRPVAFALTPGQLGDVRVALELLAPLPPPRFHLADAAYDSGGLRRFLAERGTTPVIPNNPTRKAFHPFDRRAYRKRNLTKRAFCRPKDFRRVATRYDRRADVFLSAVCLAAAVTWWL